VLVNQSSETLVGRIAYHELTPLMLREVDHMLTLWLREVESRRQGADIGG